MKTVILHILCWCIAAAAPAQSLKSAVAPIIADRCIHCHDADTKTRLNLQSLGLDLTEPATFRQWVNVYDHVISGEMPPKSEPPFDPKQRESLLAVLKNSLRTANLDTQRQRGRVPARRLTRTEYDYTVRDLLSIDGAFANLLPEESKAGSFDTVGSTQHFSALHLESYLVAADKVLDNAIRLHKNPDRTFDYDLLNNEHLNSFHDRDVSIGGSISRKLDDAVVVFRDVDYLLRSDLHGFRVRRSGSGTYRIRITAEAFQSQTPVAMKVVVKDVSGQSEFIGACDLLPGETHTFEVKAWLTGTRVFYVSMAEERSPALILADIYDAGGSKDYKGAGIMVKSIHVAGPLTGGWPPQSTRNILSAQKFTEDSDGNFKVAFSESPIADVQQVVSRIAPLAFRRPLKAAELDAFVKLAEPAIAEGQGCVDVVRIPLRAILSSPQFLLLTGKSGKLDDYALASRLSYFLWKSLPDSELLELARQRKLSKPEMLTAQVERLLQDDRSQRFLRDFVGQWLRLHEIDATTPDEKLYPEYDELLHWAVPQETEAFLSELIEKDLSVGNLIDSEFTFLNRRLAEHYGIDDVTGQELRRFNLPTDSPRGGVLTQASVLKVTANGLVTSPVKRGAFVLTELLGTPPPPPPADVGSIEPDTSGATNIRETLAKHRDVESCVRCHQLIDPPGFALECFDPIGGFRTNYRKRFDDILAFLQYEDGPAVDASGTTADGHEFRGVRDFKKQLMPQQEQLARHFISQLVVYSTGGEIQFADRDEIESIIQRTRGAGFPVRTIIHEVVQSELFRNR
jgi:hypothetical protein